MIHIWKPCTCWSAGRFVDERKSPLESLKPKHRNDEQHKYYAVCNIGIEYRYWTILNTWYYDKHLQTVQISIRIPIRLPRFGSRQLVKLPPWLDKKAANLATVGHDFTLVTPHLWEILWEDDLNWFDSILIWWLSIHDLLLLFLFSFHFAFVGSAFPALVRPSKTLVNAGSRIVFIIQVLFFYAQLHIGMSTSAHW